MLPRTRIIAHRGGAALWPENTLTAVRGAFGLAIDGVEVDVHQSRDGVAMVHHDATLDRMTDASGPLADKTARELGGVHNIDDGGPVPPLADALALWPDDAIISVELKRNADGTRHPQLAAEVTRLLNTPSRAPRSYVHAFDWRYLDVIQAQAPNLRRACNVGAEEIQALGSFAAVLVHIHNTGARDINIDHHLMTEDLVRVCHDAGLAVTLWTVNDDEDIERFLRAGVYAIVSDRPDRALALRERVEGALPQGLDIDTPRLRLTPMSEHHMPDLARVLDQKDAVTYLLNKQRQLDAARHWMTLYKDQGWGMLSVFDKETAQYRGRIGFNLQRDVGGRDRVEIGWLIDPAVWGQGLATEAAQALFAWASQRALFEAVIALVLPDNAASRRVAEKLGMHIEGSVARFGFDEVLVYAKSVAKSAH